MDEFPSQVHDNRRPSPEDRQPSGPRPIRAEFSASMVVAPGRHARRLAVCRMVEIIHCQRRRGWSERHS
jgi:hypothetical protein